MLIHQSLGLVLQVRKVIVTGPKEGLQNLSVSSHNIQSVCIMCEQKELLHYALDFSCIARVQEFCLWVFAQ